MNRIIQLTELQTQQFHEYFELLVIENQKYNLTSITSEKEVYIKHFYDSIVISKYCDFTNKSLVDVGSGAGFPGIPLKICHPDLQVTLVEPITKRANFLKMVIEKLQLKGIEVINDRSENLKTREHYDYGIARAVSQANILAELITPLLKVGGSLIMLKGANCEAEIKAMNHAKQVLNLTSERIIEEELPDQFGKRFIIIYQKDKPTSSNYPRPYSQIKNKPL